MSNVIVARFGGDAAANSQSVKKMIEIIKSNPERRYIIVSAPGTTSDAIGMTDMLYMCYSSFINGENYDSILKKISERYKEIVTGLGMNFDVDSEIDTMKRNLKLGLDYVGSRGEYIMAKILAEYLGWNFVDAFQIISFHKDRRIDKERTFTRTRERLSRIERAIIPSFYGSSPDGQIKTFPRGDCDTAGALTACAIKADLFEKWSESAKIFSADPHVIPDAKLINHITYSEALELNYCGIEIMKDDVVFMLSEAKIPMKICSIYNPDEKPMSIYPVLPEEAERHITATITGRKNFKWIRIQKYGLNKSYEFDERLHKIFAKYKIACRHYISGIHKMSIVLKNPKFDLIRNEILSDLQKEISPDSITVEQGLSLIAVIGEGMGTIKGLFGKIFASLALANIKAKMIFEGADDLNIIIGVSDSDYNNAIKALYKVLILNETILENGII